MPQDRNPPAPKMSETPDWRAFNVEPLAEHQWAVELYTPAGRRRMVHNLDESTARLIAAAPAMADALRELLQTIDPDLPELAAMETEPFFRDPYDKGMFALKLAGRSPK